MSRENHYKKLVHQRKYNLQQQRLHVSLYKIQLHQEMFVQVLPEDVCVNPEKNI